MDFDYIYQTLTKRFISEAYISNEGMLDLSRMKLRHLPEEFHTLSTLVYLNLSHNLLEEYPEGIFHMPNLVYLNLVIIMKSKPELM